jgi:hypothetical protein
MLNQKFYHSTIRKSIIAFGNMFNGIVIDRIGTDGQAEKTIRVPLSYAPRQKFIARIQQQPNADTGLVEVVLPRMAFEMVGLQYDPGRRINVIQQNRSVTDGYKLNTQYAPTPYNMAVNLYIYSKNQDDALQIVEQILPYFNPDFNLTIKAIPALNLKHDLAIILDNISYEDDFEGELYTRRSILWTLSFTVKLNFFGPITKSGYIRKSIATTYNNPDLSEQIQKYTVEPSPDTAVPGDTIDFTETFEDF